MKIDFHTKKYYYVSNQGIRRDRYDEVVSKV